MALKTRRSTRWVLSIVAVSSLLLLIGGIHIYRSQEQIIRQQIENELNGIAQLKTNQLAAWRAERLDEGNELMQRPQLRALALQTLEHPAQADTQTLLAELQALQDHDNYLDVLLVDTAGNILFSVAGSEGQVENLDILATALTRQEAVLTDVHINHHDAAPQISVFAPLFDDAGVEQGAFVLITDVYDYFYPYIQSWPTSSKTGESLLVRRDGNTVLFLNELRQSEATPLSLRIPLTATNVPSVMAVQGQQGIVVGNDYRGVPVIAALQPVPDSPWFLVAKTDIAEAFAGWQVISMLLLLLFLGSAALLGVLAVLVWEYQRRQHFQWLYEAEKRRRNDGIQYAVTLKSIGEGVIATDAQGNITMLNRVAEALTGWTNEEATGKPLTEVFAIADEDSLEPVENPVSIVLRKGEIVELSNHTVLIDHAGQARPIADAASPIRTEEGKTLGVVLVFRDQSTERAAKTALKNSEARLSATIAALPDLMFRIDHTGRFLDCQAPDPQLLLAPPEQFLGKALAEILPEGIAALATHAIDQALSSGVTQSYEYTIEMPNGRAWYEQRVARVSATEVIALTRDISDIRRNEAIVQTRLRLLESSVANSLPELLTHTLDEIGELVNSPIGFFHFVEADQRTLSLQAWSTRTQREFCTAQGAGMHYPAESAGVWADALRQRKALIHNDYAALPGRRGLPKGHAVLVRELVVPILRNDRVVAILGVGNKPTNYTQVDLSLVSFVADIAWELAERKRIEAGQKLLQEQLAQAQKLETIGQLAGGIAHDFNNMLAVILMRSELALLQVEPNSPLYRHFTEIYNTGQRSAELTRKLLGFARKQMIAPQLLNLNETVVGMMRMLQRLIGEEIVLDWQPGKDLWPVNIDPSQLDQILVNLCVNARDAIAGAGQIRIQTSNSVLDQAYIAAHPLLTAGNYVTLSVTDNGCGMNKDVLAHLFEPFFTTKEVGKGTGLGLATVYGIVQQNQGHILVYSEHTIGTTFKIYLPSASKVQPADAATLTPALPLSRGESVLLVEDDPAVLEMGADSLRKLGYLVNTAATPRIALALAKLHAGKIDLLITDVIMPESNGRALAQEITALQPGLKSLFISGYPADFIAERGVLEEGVHFLPKPFTLYQLAVSVRTALDHAEHIDHPDRTGGGEIL